MANVIMIFDDLFEVHKDETVKVKVPVYINGTLISPVSTPFLHKVRIDGIPLNELKGELLITDIQCQIISIIGLA
ncbi:MAG TPA: hypothetical protein VEC36_12680 [Patescibacteria group bacterium]|nr:hypothetical protein [Patescibacteria group bacterium]